MFSSHKHLLETYHNRNYSDLRDSFLSSLNTLINCATINELVREIFQLMHILHIDLGKDNPSESSLDFLKLYLSDDPKTRSLGARKML